MIRSINDTEDFRRYALLLNDSFSTIADSLEFTWDNCPTNNAFVTERELKAQLTDNREFYCYEDQEKAIGFVAIERSPKEDGTFYIEKLAVAPACRNRGIGRVLMKFAEKRISEMGGSLISIGIINGNTALKEWYAEQGYRETEIKSLAHLPFEVCFMEKPVED